VTENGKTLTDTATGTQPNGDAIHSTAAYTRVTPGKGIYA